MHNVPSDPRGAGVCAFASRYLEKGEVICEYEGEVITTEEAGKREKDYAMQGNALVVIESGGNQIASTQNYTTTYAVFVSSHFTK